MGDVGGEDSSTTVFYTGIVAREFEFYKGEADVVFQVCFLFWGFWDRGVEDGLETGFHRFFGLVDLVEVGA